MPFAAFRDLLLGLDRCPLCGADSDNLPCHFEDCFDAHAPSKLPLAVKPPAGVPPTPTYEWRGFPRILKGVSELVVKHLSFPELMRLRCTSKFMVPAGAIQTQMEAVFEDFVSGMKVVPSGYPDFYRRYVSCVYNDHQARPQRFRVSRLRANRNGRECDCSCPDPLAEHYDRSMCLDNMYKILRGSLLKHIVLKFKPLFNPQWADRGMVCVRSDKVLWMPARVLYELYHQAGGISYIGVITMNVDFLIGGRTMRHLDAPLIKYMWPSIRAGASEFTVDVVERSGRCRRSCMRLIHERPIFEVCRDCSV